MPKTDFDVPSHFAAKPARKPSPAPAPDAPSTPAAVAVAPAPAVAEFPADFKAAHDLLVCLGREKELPDQGAERQRQARIERLRNHVKALQQVPVHEVTPADIRAGQLHRHARRATLGECFMRHLS